MSKRTCEACGDRVPVGGGVDNLWSFADVSGGGMTLELADGSEHFLCFDCVDRLPDDETVTADDVAALSESL